MKVDIGSQTKLGSINLWQITNIRSLTNFLKSSKLLSIHCHLSYSNSRGKCRKISLVKLQQLSVSKTVALFIKNRVYCL